MILLTARDTGLAAHVDEQDITLVDPMGPRARPYSRIYLQNKKENHDFYLDVNESPTEVSRRIRHEKLDLGCEARANLG